ncbi:MAG TPA: hypothetical protein VE967_17715 [Gemmatimonadaceae bacterium]|nr:hypothetical protein [Gemmatimonadaceae bacterium]
MAARKVWWRLAQVALIALTLWLVWRSFASGDDPAWPKVVRAWHDLHFRPWPLVGSCVVVYVSYAVLIETWRRTVALWGGMLPYSTAARIWFVSNLGRWIPGKIWQITAMGALAQQSGVPAVAAVGSSLLIAVVNVISAFVVSIALATRHVPIPRSGVYVIALATIAVLLAPNVVPGLVRWAAKKAGRDVTWPPIPPRAILVAFVGCSIAWILYGVAFQLLVSSMYGSAAGATRDYITAFTLSYIVGYLFIFAPGGIGTRELMLTYLLKTFELATDAVSAVIVVVSRVWLTILELVPGLILLAITPKPATSRGPDR